MKNVILKKALIYAILLIVLSIFIDVLNEVTVGTQFEGVGRFISILALTAILIYIGISINKKHVRKKYIIYLSIFAGQIIVISLISFITGVETSNTWLGSIGATLIFLTIAILLFDIAKSICSTHALVANILYLAIVIIAITTVVTSVAFWARL